jgi:hypothetical protein
MFSHNIISVFSFQGVVSVRGNPRRVLLQAVHELYDRQDTTVWEQDTIRINRMVFIGELIYLRRFVLAVTRVIGAHWKCHDDLFCTCKFPSGILHHVV